jgi:hypothetical protein
MYLYRATVYMCIGWCMMLARARAERAPRSEAPALALASAVSGHDGGSHHGERGGDEGGGERSGVRVGAAPGGAERGWRTKRTRDKHPAAT